MTSETNRSHGSGGLGRIPSRPSIPRLEGSLVVLATATLTAVLTGPGQTIGVSVFIDHFIADLRLSRSWVSTAYLVGTLGGAALLPRVGRFVDRRGVRPAQMLIGLCFGVAVAAMSGVQGFVTLALGFAGIRFLGQGSLSLVSVVTVSVSFVRRRGTALGLFTTVSAGLMALVPLGLEQLISAVGWRRAWLVAGAIVVCTVVPLAVFGLRAAGPSRSRTNDDAADSGGTDQTTVVRDSTGEGEPAPTVDMDRGAALRTGAFWALAATGSTASMLVTALNFHQIELLQQAGLTSTAAAAMFLPQVIGSTVAALAVGALSDRGVDKALLVTSMMLLAGAHVLAAVVSPGATVVLYAVLLGSAGGAIRTSSSALLPAWFGTAHLGNIQGTLTFIGVAASAVGPVALAVTKSGLNSWSAAVLALAIVPALVAAVVAARMHPPSVTG